MTGNSPPGVNRYKGISLQSRRNMALLRRPGPTRQVQSGASHWAWRSPVSGREDRDGLDTRRKKLHALPRPRPAAKPRDRRGGSPAGAGLALAGLGRPESADLSL